MTAGAPTRTVLKGFQQDAVDNGVVLLVDTTRRLALLDPGQAADRAAISADTGHLLLEAPTGAGKTLIAGHIAEKASAAGGTPVIWFWFAPFAGVVVQSQRVITREFPGLRLRSLTTDRQPGMGQSGDIYVETWASVSASDEAKRKATRATEGLLAMSDFVTDLRRRGFVIGTVIDEAHHTFRGENQAITFYRDVLKPELTVLTTATPDDADLRAFKATMGIAELRRIRVSRQSAVDAGLVKREVKAALYKVDPSMQGLIDFKKTALHQAAKALDVIKEHMAAIGARMAPLMLVQVDSEDDGDVPRATAWLEELGFRTSGQERLYRVHTADRPDKDLDTIAADDRVEALVFKMAVATGFDAPRAAILVSFRTVRDVDFGVQLVGRILRLDRRLQVIEPLPDILNTGFVFLADSGSQAGLEGGADRINRMTDELASTEAKVNVFAVGDQRPTAQKSTGQGDMLATSVSGAGELDAATPAGTHGDDVAGGAHDLVDAADDDGGVAPDPALFELMGLLPPGDDDPSVGGSKTGGGRGGSGTGGGSLHSYALRDDLDFPRNFHRVLVSIDSSLVADVATSFEFDAEAMMASQRTSMEILESQKGLFTKATDAPIAIQADIAQGEIDARAQRTLFASDADGFLDPQELHGKLLAAFDRAIVRTGLRNAFATAESKEQGLARVLALRPLQLRKAVDEVVKRHLRSEPADPLPDILRHELPLPSSRLNLYRVVPPGLNGWERTFAQLLDDDTTGVVQWWHRNPVRRPYSVSYPVPGQPDFYPDFVVGVKGRARKDGILLVETKRVYNDPEGNAQGKSQVEHSDYGRAMMLYLETKDEPPRWWIIEFSPSEDRNILDRLFRVELMAKH